MLEVHPTDPCSPPPCPYAHPFLAPQRVLGSVLDVGQRKSFLREAAAATALEAAARMDRTAVAAAAAEGQPLAAILTAPLAEATPEVGGSGTGCRAREQRTTGGAFVPLTVPLVRSGEEK